MARRRKDDLTDANRGMRLHKALADAGVGSRRACEALIAEGRVQVNGQTITKMPVWVDPAADQIRVDDRTVRPRRRGHLYVMVNKPRGVICTNSDPEGRRRITDLVPHDQRLFCVGRLDAESTGLVLLTDDGALAQTLTHPRYGITKTYQVTVKGKLDGEATEKLTDGVWLADRRGNAARSRASSVRVLQGDRAKTRLLITLQEGRNREIRRMLARLKLPVRRLERQAIGPLRLKGLAPGEWRRLQPPELSSLRSAARRAADKAKR